MAICVDDKFDQYESSYVRELGLGLGFVRLPSRRTVLHITHFGVCRYLQDGPAYNLSGYMQDHPAYNIILVCLLLSVTTTPEPTPRPRIEYQIATWSLVGASVITLIVIAALGITLWRRTRSL